MSDSALDQKLLSIHDRMLTYYGRQHWWPADTPFEMMVGAVLTQATAWTNVELAIGRLKEADALSSAAIRGMEPDKLASLIYSSGFYNAKAQRLKALVEYLGNTYEDDIAAMRLEGSAKLRRELLAVRGIGEETADAILLYALGKHSFVIDAYTRRLFKRLGIVPESEAYSAYQRMFSDNLPCDAELFGDTLIDDTALFAEYHALIVEHCKVACRTKPVCEGCCLLSVCPTGWANTEAARCP